MAIRALLTIKKIVFIKNKKIIIDRFKKVFTFEKLICHIEPEISHESKIRII